MRVFSLMAQKGGTGKTTLAIHLAVFAEQLGKSVVLIDLDPQRSALEWWKVRKAETPVMVEAAAVQLSEIIRVSRSDGIDLVIIDTPPFATFESEEAARVSDFVVIPCQPGFLDIRAIVKTVHVVQSVGAKGGIVLSQCPPLRGLSESGIVTEARTVLEGYELPVCPTAVIRRAAYSNALIDGRAVTEFEPKGKAAREIQKLWEWIEEIKK